MRGAIHLLGPVRVYGHHVDHQFVWVGNARSGHSQETNQVEKLKKEKSISHGTLLCMILRLGFGLGSVSGTGAEAESW